MIRHKIAIAAKAATTIAIIWLVLSHVDLGPVASRLTRLGPIEIAIGMLPFVVQLVLGAERWRIICGRLGVALRFGPALHFGFIGMFFNQTLPSAVGGDAMRVWLLVRDGVAWGKALNTVLCDRVLALVVLVGLSAGTLPLFYRHVADANARYGVTAFVTITIVGFVVFLAMGNRIGYLLSLWRFTRPFGDLANDFHSLFTAPSVTFALVMWSLTIHVLTIAAVWVIATILGIDATLLDCLIIVPPVVLITMLPVSIAGWGVREGAMVIGFGFVGIAASDALAMSVVFGLAYILLGLPGGLLWFWTRQATTPNIASAKD